MKKKIAKSIPWQLVPLSLLQKMSGRHFVLPFYHIVYPSTRPHIRYLYRYFTPEEFNKQIDYFLKHWQPISYEELIKLHQNGNLNKSKVFHLTFDDGLYECYDVIAPILYKKGVPATFFVHSQALENPAFCFYRFKISLLIWHVRKNGLSQKVKILLKKHYDIQLQSIKHLLKTVDHKNIHVIDFLWKETSFDYDKYLSDRPIYMSMNEINKLMENGFQIGSHSLNHIRFSTLSFEDQWREFEEDKLKVEKLLGMKNIPFAFPFGDQGVKISFFNKVKKHYPETLLFGSGLFSSDHADNIVHRVPMENFHMQPEKSIPALYFHHSVKKLLGRETIYRK